MIDRMKWERTCSVCGRTFHSRHWGARYCSDACRQEQDRRRHRREWVRKVEEGELVLRNAECPGCGTVFQTANPTAVYCPRCVEVRLVEMRRRMRERENEERTAVAVPPLRRCHDCGKPCSNFRCASCWAKLRSRLGIEIDPEIESDGPEDMEDLE